MNIETDRAQLTNQEQPWPPVICSAVIALTAISVGRCVFDSITGLFLTEVVLGGFAGRRYRAFALPGAVLAFLAWVSFEMLRNDSAFHGEGRVAFLLMFVGTAIFAISGFVVCLLTKKWEDV